MAREQQAGPTSAVSPPAAGDLAIYLCRDAVDFRMGINGLSALVEATLKYDPFSRNLFPDYPGVSADFRGRTAAISR